MQYVDAAVLARVVFSNYYAHSVFHFSVKLKILRLFFPLNFDDTERSQVTLFGPISSHGWM